MEDVETGDEPLGIPTFTNATLDCSLALIQPSRASRHCLLLDRHRFHLGSRESVCLVGQISILGGKLSDPVVWLRVCCDMCKGPELSSGGHACFSSEPSPWSSQDHATPAPVSAGLRTASTQSDCAAQYLWHLARLSWQWLRLVISIGLPAGPSQMPSSAKEG